jgi:hypothetical protein
MRICGRSLDEPFNTFWNHYRNEIMVPIELIEEGHSSVFGDLGADRTDSGTPEWVGIPDGDFSYHVAHELAHLVLKKRGYPKIFASSSYSSNSADHVRVAGDLEDMIIHFCVNQLLERFEFRNPYIKERFYHGALHGIQHSPVPETGNLWFFTWAIRYCELKRDLDGFHWNRIEQEYVERCPVIREFGHNLHGIVCETGWCSRDETLVTMIKVRDTIDALSRSDLLVVDPISGKSF